MTLSGRLAKLVLAGLVLSLCINVFAAGLAVGRWSGPRFGDHRSGGFGVEPFLAELPPPARERIRGELAEHRGQGRERFQTLQAARRAVGDAVRAEPFDAAALDAALSRLREETGNAQATMHQAFAKAVADLPASEREKIAGGWRGRR